MEMFDTHRRDILNFDNYMDLKKPGFGGPQSAIALRDARGSKIDKSPKLDGYRRTVERDPAFSHPVYDPTYKAMTNDLVYKQEKKKPFTYDHTVTGIPVVEIEPVKEGRSFSSFQRFIGEEIDSSLEDEMREDNPDELGYGTDELDDEEYRDYGMYPEDDTELDDPYFSKGDEEYPYETEGDEEYRDYGMYPEDDEELDDAESRLRSFE